MIQGTAGAVLVCPLPRIMFAWAACLNEGTVCLRSACQANTTEHSFAVKL